MRTAEVVATRGAARAMRPTAARRGVSRSRLDHRYRGADGRLVRVLAPAGYGKTTLVARWVADEARAVRWLDLEPIDNDPAVVMRALVNGLADLIDGDMTPPASNASRDTRPVVLVLDDIHHVVERAAWNVVEAVTSHLPAGSTVVLVGREQVLDDAVPRLRLDPGVIDVTAEDLAFDVAETEELLLQHGVEVDLAELSELAARFEGWPAGLRLASLALASPDSRAASHLSDAGELTYVTDYLSAEWLAPLTPGVRTFLMECACLGSFDSDMCDVVLDRTGSAAIIGQLARRQLVVPLDRRGASFRMHELLRGWLESDLRHLDRARWHEVHVDAARWWERAGDVDMAMEHLERIDDQVRRSALVASHGWAQLARGRAATVRRWIASMPDADMQAWPGVRAVRALDVLGAGDARRALHWSNELRAGPESCESEIVCAALAPAGAAGSLDAARRASAALSAGPWRAFARLTYGGLLAIAGDDRATELLAEAMDHDSVGAPAERAACVALGAIVADLDADRERAASMGEQARALMAELRLDVPPMCAIPTLAVSALLDARAGRRDRAVPTLERCRAMLAGVAHVAPWLNVLPRLALVRAALLIDDPSAACTLLREIDHHLRFEPPDAPIRAAVVELGLQVDSARSMSVDRTWSLTSAESRVLQHLPTNLSLADIATLLYVSRNTVKSHTSSIYRKLGTTSRGRAVELARGAGLLIDPVAPRSSGAGGASQSPGSSTWSGGSTCSSNARVSK